MKKFATLVLCTVLLAGCSTGTPTMDKAQETMSTPETPVAQPSTVTIPLTAVQSSGQNGTVTLMDLGGGKTQVNISLSGGSFTSPQPAHIHMGTCAKPGDVKYPLSAVIDGVSESVIDAPMSSLWSGNLLVNVHKSEKEVNVYTACGDLTTSETQAPQLIQASPVTDTIPTY